MATDIDVERLLNIGIALSSVHDLDQLLDMILLEAQRLTNADGASIFLVEGNKLAFRSMRSNTYFRKYGEEKVKEMFKSFEMPLTKMSIAGYVALEGRALNIRDVKKIPPGSGYRYNSDIDEKYGYTTVSLLVVPMKDQKNTVIGVLELINAMNGDKVTEFTGAHEKITASFSSQAAVAIQNARLNEQLKDAHFDTIFRLSVAAEYRDKETSNHIKRVSHYSRIIAEHMGLCAEDCSAIYWSAPMHDIGKLGIPDAILHKPGPLTPEERLVMEQHSVIGALVLRDSNVPIIEKSKIVALTHHEKFDGTGYPMRLKGAEIPYEGRIVALADVFDALTSKRVYKPAMPEDKVMQIMKEGREKHFDPEVVDVFFREIAGIKEIRDKYGDTEEEFDKFKDVKNADLKELLGG
jgi:putative two-component system response regulator